MTAFSSMQWSLASVDCCSPCHCSVMPARVYIITVCWSEGYVTMLYCPPFDNKSTEDNTGIKTVGQESYLTFLVYVLHSSFFPLSYSVSLCLTFFPPFIYLFLFFLFLAYCSIFLFLAFFHVSSLSVPLFTFCFTFLFPSLFLLYKLRSYSLFSFSFWPFIHSPTLSSTLPCSFMTTGMRRNV